MSSTMNLHPLSWAVAQDSIVSPSSRNTEIKLTPIDQEVSLLMAIIQNLIKALSLDSLLALRLGRS
jgi:hypothetical protein